MRKMWALRGCVDSLHEYLKCHLCSNESAGDDEKQSMVDEWEA